MKKFYFLTLALILGAMTMSAKTIYLNTGGSGLWNQAGAKFEAWAWGGSTADAWYDFTLVEGGTGIYKTEMPDDRTGMKILRKDPNSASHSWDDKGKWNETGDISFVDGKNMYTITGWGTSDGKWENYETYVPEEPVSLKFTVTVPEGTKNCYIIGPKDWTNFVQMTKVTETQYTITLDNILKSTCQYKYTCGESWDYVEMQSDGVTDVANRNWAENDVVVAWKAMPVVATPVITMDENDMISIACATDDVTIYYTTDGTTPTTSSTEYTEAFKLEGGATVKAIAVKNGWVDSATATATFEQVATPEISIDDDDMISITCANVGATIYYTTDGTTPTTTSTRYTEAFKLNQDATVKAIAVKAGLVKSAVANVELTTAIEEVGVDAGEAVYYNLQGVKVANPENGIFIKKQGNKTTKVVL